MIECTSGKQTIYWLDLIFHKVTVILDVYLLSYLTLSYVGEELFNMLIEKSFSKSSWMPSVAFILQILIQISFIYRDDDAHDNLLLSANLKKLLFSTSMIT